MTFQIPSGGVGIIPLTSVHKNAVDQTGIITDTWTKLTWSTVLANIGDPQAIFDNANDRFTPNSPGKYLVIAVATWIDIVTTGGVNCFIETRKNNGLNKRLTYYPAVGQGVSMQISDILDMNGTTDYVEVFVRHATGVNQAIFGEAQATYFMIFKIAGAPAGV